MSGKNEQRVRAFVDHLKANKWLAWKPEARLVRTAGMPHIIGVKRGQIVAVYVNQEASLNQLRFAQKLEDEEVVVIYATETKDIQKAIKTETAKDVKARTSRKRKPST